MRNPGGRCRPATTLVILLGLLTLTGCVQSSKIQTSEPSDVRELSPKLNPFVFFEDGILFLGVDSRAAQYVKKGEIFPLGIGLANQSKGTMRFNTESFVLETADGQRFPVVTFEEFRSNYNRSNTDARLSDEFQGLMRSRFQSYAPPLSWRPFPASGGTGTSRREVELGRNLWTMAYLYFPVPEEGIHAQEFTLLASPNGNDETFLVRFKIR